MQTKFECRTMTKRDLIMQVAYIWIDLWEYFGFGFRTLNGKLLSFKCTYLSPCWPPLVPVTGEENKLANSQLRAYLHSVLCNSCQRHTCTCNSTGFCASRSGWLGKHLKGHISQTLQIYSYWVISFCKLHTRENRLPIFILSGFLLKHKDKQCTWISSITM